MDTISDNRDYEVFTYATSKLDAAALLSALFPTGEMSFYYRLGFISTAYTLAHEAMELLLKSYLIRVSGMDQGKVRGHDLGRLFSKWDDTKREEAEVTYQRNTLQDLEVNRISKALGKEALDLGPHGQFPDDYIENKEKYDRSCRNYMFSLLEEGRPSFHDVVNKLDGSLGKRNIARLLKSNRDGVFEGFLCDSAVWYPEELLQMKWEKFYENTKQRLSLGLVMSFLEREGAYDVFQGWRYQSEKILEGKNITFHGPPAKMILMARCLERIVWRAMRAGRDI